MSIYKRGGVYWYKFMWNGQVVRESTKQGSDKKARNMEATRRAGMAREQAERETAKKQLGCDRVARCVECGKWFDETRAIGKSKQCVFCSTECSNNWQHRHEGSATLKGFIDRKFEPWARAQFEVASPKTWQGWYRTSLKAIKGYASLADCSLDEITEEKIAEFAAHRQSEGLQPSSINACLRVLRRTLRMAVAWGATKVAPKVQMLRGERHRERVVSEKEEARYLSAAPALLADVATVLVDTGMRPEECFRLRWESLTWANGRFGTLLVTHGKTAAARRLIPMTPRVRHVLETRWETAKKPDEGWVWTAPTKSEHIESSSLKKKHSGTFKTINKAVKEENEKATCEAEKQKPITPWVLYSFRHTFLTRLGESGCDAWTLARIAGHSSITISQRYVHPSENAVMDAFSRLGGHRTGHSRRLKQ